MTAVHFEANSSRFLEGTDFRRHLYTCLHGCSTRQQGGETVDLTLEQGKEVNAREGSRRYRNKIGPRRLGVLSCVFNWPHLRVKAELLLFELSLRRGPL